MYDAKKIVPGLIIFLGVVTLPIWCTATSGEAKEPPKLVYPTNAKKCIEDAAWMRANHMELLNTWRNKVVRESLRTYVATDGSEYDVSLTNTCLEQCHINKSTFCDSCHTYTEVDPYCWDCHVLPKGAK